MQGHTTPMETENQRWYSNLSYNEWVALSPNGQSPIERYKHAATIADDKLYIIGGSLNSIYLSDFQVLDLKTLRWSAIKLNMKATDKDGSQLEVFPGTSGLSMIKWKSRLLLLAGVTRSTTYKLTVRYIDLETYNCGVVETFGDIPVPRRGQSITRFGSKIIMFGGKDLAGRPLNDLHVLDLERMTWSAVETTQERPTPRFDHVAVVHAERYLYIFGGCSHSTFFSDLHVLDLERMEWSRPLLSSDLVMNARAGHAGAAVDGKWYIVGGRSGADCSKSLCETLVMNMSTLVVSMLTTVKVNDSPASEGLSISSITLGGENFLITFGGFNGTFLNKVFAMRLKPTVAASMPNAAITIKQMNGSEYAEFLRAQEQVARNFQVGDFLGFLNETSPVPEIQLALLPRPIGHELVDIAGTSAEGGKKRMSWLKTEDTLLAHAFVAATAVKNKKKRPSLWVRAAKFYNENKPAFVNRRTSDLMRPHWHSLKAKVFNFNTIYRRIHSEYADRRSAQEIVSLSHVKYNDVYNCMFKHEHVWEIVKDHPEFIEEAINVPSCSKEASTSEAGGCTSANSQEANAARISGQKRNEEGMTKSNTEQLSVQKKARVNNSSPNQDKNAGGNRITGRMGNGTEQLLVQESARIVNISSSNQDANANGGHTQIIGQERKEVDENTEQLVESCNCSKLKLELKKAKIEAKNREIFLKEYEILCKDTSDMTEEQRAVHARACEIITQRWKSGNI